MIKHDENIWFEASRDRKLLNPTVILNSLRKFGADVEQENCNFKYYYFTWGEAHQEHRHHWDTFRKYFGGFKEAMEQASVKYDPQYRNKLQPETVKKELIKFCNTHPIEKRTAQSYYLWPQRRLGYASYKKIHKSWYKALEIIGYAAPQSSKSSKLTDDDILEAVERICIWTYQRKRTIPRTQDFKEYNQLHSDGVSWATLKGRFYKSSDFMDNFFAWKRGETTKQHLLKQSKKRARKVISPKLRYEIFKRDGFKCLFCGISGNGTILNADHIIPVDKGGEDTMENLQTLCVRCNIGKGTDLIKK